MARTDIEWIERNNPKPVVMSILGKDVASLLGDVFQGIYHLEDSALFHKRVEWDSQHHIEIVLYGPIATYDGNALTRLVVIAHDRCIRVSITAANIGYLRLMFHQRTGQKGSVSKTHPTLDEHTKLIRGSIKL
jgi:hypothetical protein